METTVELTTLLPAETGLALLEDDLSAAKDYLAQEKAESTRLAYQSDFRIFAAYCSDRGLSPMPASPKAVMGFISAEARGGEGRGGAAAIRYAHRLAGHEPPTNSEAVKATLRGIRQSIGTAPTKKAPATAEVLRLMLDACPDTMKGKRDRALLALGFAGAFRRSELVALEVQDLLPSPDGLRVLVRKSKTDQEGQGAEVAILRGVKLRPVKAVEDWLAASGIESGPVFRSVTRVGKVGRAALSACVVRHIVQRYVEAVGLDKTAFALTASGAAS